MFWFVLREESGISFQQHPPSVVVVVVVLYSKLATKRIYWNPSLQLSEWQQRRLLLRFASAVENYKQVIWSCSGKEEWEWGGNPFACQRAHSCIFPSAAASSTFHVFPPLQFTMFNCQKKKKTERKRCRYHGGSWTQNKVQPCLWQKHAFVWGLGNVGQFITSLPSFAVSDIPRDSSLSSQVIALFLS